MSPYLNRFVFVLPSLFSPHRFILGLIFLKSNGGIISILDMLRIMTSTLLFPLLFTSLLFSAHCRVMQRCSRMNIEIVFLFTSTLPTVMVEAFFPTKTFHLILLIIKYFKSLYLDFCYFSFFRTPIMF